MDMSNSDRAKLALQQDVLGEDENHNIGKDTTQNTSGIITEGKKKSARSRLSNG